MSKRIFLAIVILLGYTFSSAQSRALVFQSDFGLKDGAVAAMKGVAYSVSRDLDVFDLTHEIPPYNIWEGAYRLKQSASYWPAGTVFVSVVDPGVGSERKSIVMRSKTGHYFVTPDNGTLTLVADQLGVDEVREIDELRNRLSRSDLSYTFHGRDVYAYTGARLASGIISFEEVGAVLEMSMVSLPYQKAVMDGGVIHGTVDIHDVQYGNVWTNIDRELFSKLGAKAGDLIEVKIFSNKKMVYSGSIPYGNTFAEVNEGKPLLYLNSLLNVSFGINQGSFAGKYKIGSGSRWTVTISK